MKLYCIDDKHNGEKINITIGNFYDVLYQQHFEVIIRNDKGKKSSYSLNRFATKSQYREIKLNEILSHN
jgi:hypothetical protein